MIERFLTDVVGVPWDDVHEEAEQLEHAMTPRFEAYVRATVGDAKTCPHGHPIRVGERIDGVPLADCSPGAKVTILRFENEAEDLLHYLKQAGLEPGLDGEVADNDGEYVTVRSDGGESMVTVSVAETVSVLAEPSPPARIALPEQLVLGQERYGR
jgi:DtxR family Mn-dependent transcriptional regulator